MKRVLILGCSGAGKTTLWRWPSAPVCPSSTWINTTGGPTGLDFPKATCLWRVTKRTAACYGRTRPDLADGCPEQIDLTFFRYVATFRRNSRPRLMSALNACGGRRIILSRPFEVPGFLESMPSPLPPAGRTA